MVPAHMHRNSASSNVILHDGKNDSSHARIAPAGAPHPFCAQVGLAQQGERGDRHMSVS